MSGIESSKQEARYLYAILITTLILAAEIIGGILTGSLALLSDSAHMLTDVFALAISYGAFRIARKPVDNRHTFGYQRVEVFAALINGFSLAIICGGIWWEAVERLITPGEVNGLPMLIIAAVGLVANILVALVLKPGHHHPGHDHTHDHKKNDINMESAYLHVIGDALSSIGVIIAGLAIWLTGALWIDPLISIGIGIMIAISSFRLLRRSVHILLEGTPDGLSIPEVKSAIGEVNGVDEVHDLHIWNIGSDHASLSAHVTLKPEDCGNQPAILDSIRRMLLDRFSLHHVTIQIETENCGQGCQNDQGVLE